MHDAGVSEDVLVIPGSVRSGSNGRVPGDILRVDAVEGDRKGSGVSPRQYYNKRRVGLMTVIHETSGTSARFRQSNLGCWDQHCASASKPTDRQGEMSCMRVTIRVSGLWSPACRHDLLDGREYELASPFIFILTLVSTRHARRRLGEPQWPAALPPLLPVHRGKHLVRNLFGVPGVFMLHHNSL